MRENKKATGHATTIAGGIFRGEIISLLFAAILIMIFARLMERNVLVEMQIGIFVMFILLTTSFIGCCVAIRMIKRRVLLVTVVFEIVYAVLMISITALFFGGMYDGIFPGVLLIICGSTLSMACFMKPNRRSGNAFLKRNYR